MPYGITQCYLLPGRGDIPAFTPAEAGTGLHSPEFSGRDRENMEKLSLCGCSGHTCVACLTPLCTHRFLPQHYAIHSACQFWQVNCLACVGGILTVPTCYHF